MKYKVGAMVYGENLDIKFIGIISEYIADGRVKLDSVIMNEKEWVNISSSIYEKESSIKEVVDVDLFDLFHDVKKQKPMTIDEYLITIFESQDD